MDCYRSVLGIKKGEKKQYKDNKTSIVIVVSLRKKEWEKAIQR